MSLLPLSGRARVFGNDVNTDYIISSSRKKETIDPAMLRQFLLEQVEPGFARSVRPGDIIVAGSNFGCGSAMEVAVTTVLAVGIRAVIARSFSRTYWRNAMNNGLLTVVADTTRIAEGDALQLALDPAGNLILRAGTKPEVCCEPLPPFMRDMLDAGGLVPYLRERGGFA
ncbi:MAG TPA: alpha-IPM isomerase [Ramlibacter sp.]|nr:alpha-IPM isomerase [Ramlibacter sp.]